jgi:DNA replication protein DnaC
MSANGLNLEICLLWFILVLNMKAPNFLKSKRNRLLFFGTILITCVFATIYCIYNESYVETFLTRFIPEYSKIITVAVPVIIGSIVLGLCIEIIGGDLHDWLKDSDKEPQTLADNLEPDIKLLFDSLTERYKKRYESKLDGRFEITLEVNKEPFTVNYQTNKNVDEAFKAIKESFNQKGRLLIVGSPGSGKTVLLLKLAIELLGDNCKADQKLPVIFNLASWSPVYAKFDDWLIDVLNAGNGLSKDFARTLLEQNRIIFLLDGLDELARNEDRKKAKTIRNKCLKSIYDYTTTTGNVIVSCRLKDLPKIPKDIEEKLLLAKVEIFDLTNESVQKELNRFREVGKEQQTTVERIEDVLKTNEAFYKVLNTPFYLNTALDVFSKLKLSETKFPKTIQAIKDYLVNKFIENKISNLNLTKFEKDKAKILKWLSWLAKLMEKKQLVNFELADLHLLDSKKVRFHFAFIIGVLSTILFSFIFSLKSSIFIGLAFLIANLNIKIITLDIHKWNFFSIIKFRHWSKGIAGSLIFGGFISIMLYLITFDKVFSYTFGFSAGLVTGVFALLFGEVRQIQRFVLIDYPYKRIKSRIFFSVFGVQNLFPLMIYCVWEFATVFPMLEIISFTYFYHFIFSGIIWGIINTAILKHLVLRFCLWLKGSTPLKYATFLNLAAEARILEKDGGHWRFRHQTLQEHFAKSGNDLSAE